MDQKYDFQKTESDLEQFWTEQEIYKYNNGKERKIFSIDTPPPTVSGKLHIGHVFSYTQAEMIARFKRMQGFDVFYPFGFDDNGLPTERLVEKAQTCCREANFGQNASKPSRSTRRNFKISGNGWGSAWTGVCNIRPYPTCPRRSPSAPSLNLQRQGKRT